MNEIVPSAGVMFSLGEFKALLLILDAGMKATGDQIHEVGLGVEYATAQGKLRAAANDLAARQAADTIKAAAEPPAAAPAKPMSREARRRQAAIAAKSNGAQQPKAPAKA